MQEKVPRAREHCRSRRRIGQYAGNGNCSNHRCVDRKKSAFFIGGAPARHEGKDPAFVPGEFGKDPGFRCFAGTRQFRRQRGERTTTPGVIAVFRTQIHPHNRLPGGARLGLFGSLRQPLTDFLKRLAQRLKEQFILVLEVFVEPSVGESGIPHDGGNRGTGQTFRTKAPRGVFHDLAMYFRFMVGAVAHG